MTIFLVEIDRFGFQTEQSGILLIDIVIWILSSIYAFIGICVPSIIPTTPEKPFISSKVLVVFLKSLSLWPFNELVLVIVYQSHGDSMK